MHPDWPRLLCAQQPACTKIEKSKPHLAFCCTPCVHCCARTSFILTYAWCRVKQCLYGMPPPYPSLKLDLETNMLYGAPCISTSQNGHLFKDTRFAPATAYLPPTTTKHDLKAVGAQSSSCTTHMALAPIPDRGTTHMALAPTPDRGCAGKCFRRAGCNAATNPGATRRCAQVR